MKQTSIFGIVCLLVGVMLQLIAWFSLSQAKVETALDHHESLQADDSIPHEAVSGVTPERVDHPYLSRCEVNETLAMAPSSQKELASKLPLLSSSERVKAWALVDPAFDVCIRQPNGPWALIPDDATAQQIEVFKYLVKAAIETSDRERERFRGHELEHQAELRQLDLDRQREFASSFRFVWPNARQPE